MGLSEVYRFAVALVMFPSSLINAVTILLTETGGNEKTAQRRGKPKGIGLDTPLPEDLPSVVEVKRALPKECFEPKLATSMYYVITDFIKVAVTFAVFFYLDSLVSSQILRALLIYTYWAIQGTMFIAIFVLGHDCGHGSFSDFPLVNDAVGTVLHGFLMAPFYPWKLSHRWHHMHTGNIDKDEVFYPVRESEPGAQGKTLPGLGFGVGWFGYLFRGYNPRPVFHFNPFDKMFVGHVFGCLCSLASLGVMAYFLHMFYSAYGLTNLLIYYAVPDFIFASYIVIITFLHHNEMSIPWYSDDRWDFVRGQLSTIDRHYGAVHDMIHNITTHQMHHMFAKIPHYQLENATKHFRKAFPHLVRTCDEPVLESFARMYVKYDDQAVIPDDTKVFTYK